MKLNRKGYLAVEIILASVITVIIAFFLIELTMDLVSTTDDAYLDTVLITDKVLVTNNIKRVIESDRDRYGEISDVQSSIENECKISYLDSANFNFYDRYIGLDYDTDKELYYVYYGYGSNSYKKYFDKGLSNVGLTCSGYNNDSNKEGYEYYFFKISGENIFTGNYYDINILVYDGL